MFHINRISIILIAFFRMNKIQLQEYAEFVSKRFNDPMISSPLRWLWLGNYVDSILRYTSIIYIYFKVTFENY